MQLEFFKGKQVFITGHTGFKGTWLSKILINLGAIVTGYALEANTKPNIFGLSNIENKMNSIIGDMRDESKLKNAFFEAKPEIVFHLAAQPLVRESYINPKDTYEINVMGTVNILECIRESKCVKSFLNVTTDKVYKNKEWMWGYRENEELDGFDPYSNSKSCSELVTRTYADSFFCDMDVAISTARAGNVIGGGDFSKDRIIPDCISAAMDGNEIIVRNPNSTRPYQHVLEPLFVYLMIAQEQYIDKAKASSYNVGPDDKDCITTGELVDIFCKEWTRQTSNQINWKYSGDGGPHEANYLKLDCSKVKATFNWKPHWGIEKTMEKIVEWTVAYQKDDDISNVMENQIQEFLSNSFGGKE